MLAVLTTVDDEKAARAIAEALVERRLAACVQVSQIESHYRWEGAVQRDREFRILCKTTADRYDAVESAIVDLHPYDLPAVFAFETAAAYPPFEAWVGDEVRVAPADSDTPAGEATR
jgi:periplasmic divalent cation tolerance protein